MTGNIIVFVLSGICIFLVYILSKEIKKQQKIREKSKQILRMLAGDKKTALRLVKNIHNNYPDRSYIWCQEKVIRDLQRDRRY